MRVIAGEFKGRTLKSVPGKSTRPTSDKVKEAVFQMIGPYFNKGYCLDLFAGSGSLGIEALSRGMEGGIFIDRSPYAIQTINKNIQLLKLGERTEVYKTDAFRALQAINKRQLTFDLIFIDPPYGKIDLTKLLALIAEYDMLNNKGMVYCEYGTKEQFENVEDHFLIKKQVAYGATTSVMLLQRKNT